MSLIKMMKESSGWYQNWRMINMSNFTYEKKQQTSGLETYEWDNVWWEQAPDKSKERVLYIGDSISCGIRQVATRLSEGQLLFDGFGTSKAVDNPYFAESVRIFGKQQEKRNVVLFNNGLHGWHLEDTREYKAHYEKMVQFLLEEYKGTTFALVLTTCIEGERNERVIVRNQVVQQIAEKYALPVIDLYSTSVEYVYLRSGDGVHFTAEGYEELAKQILRSINIMKLS